LTEVKVNRKAADRVASGHLWIFSSDIQDASEAEAGAVVKVVDHKGRPLGMAHFSSSSQIALRLLSTQMEAVDSTFFRKRLEAAEAYRRVVVDRTDAYRLVHAEADLLPGLIVDRYGDYFVLQALDQGMDRSVSQIVACLVDLFGPKGIVSRNDAPVRLKEKLSSESVVCGEVPPEVAIGMNGLVFGVDLLHGQKTGMFLDQRENYLAAAAYAHGRALDCFTSTGGFAFHLASRCESVEAVDSSAPALEMASRNARANGISNVVFRQADAFDLLTEYASARRQFATVVLDPPAFAKSRRNVEDAARGYKELNLRALRLLSSGGILVTCSCSHHMSEATLLEIVAEASLDAGRRLRVIERRTQSRDHPILLTVPETHYLKCLILQVV
jgi:23S rRNA (cytosine1962-C5)-methyltransferase